MGKSVKGPAAKQEKKTEKPAEIKKDVESPKTKKREGKGPEAEPQNVSDPAAKQKNDKGSAAESKKEIKPESTSSSPGNPNRETNLTQSQRGSFAPPSDEQKAGVPAAYTPKKPQPAPETPLPSKTVNNHLDTRSPVLSPQTDDNPDQPVAPITVGGKFENKASTGNKVVAEKAAQVNALARPGRVLNQSELTPAQEDNPVARFTQILSDIGKKNKTTPPPQSADVDPLAMPDWLPENSRPSMDTLREAIVVDGKTVGVVLPDASPGDVNGWVTVDGASYVSYTAESDSPESVRFITQDGLPTPEATGGTDEENSAGTLGIFVAAVTKQTDDITTRLSTEGFEASAANLTGADGNNYVAIGSRLYDGNTVGVFERGAQIVDGEHGEFVHSHPFNENPEFVEPSQTDLELARNYPDINQFVAAEKEDGSISIINYTSGLYRDQFTVQNDANIERPEDGSITLFRLGSDQQSTAKPLVNTVKLTPTDLNIPVSERTAEDFTLEFARNGEPVFIPSDIPKEQLFRFVTEGAFDISEQGNISAQLNRGKLNWAIDAQNSRGTAVIREPDGYVSFINDYALEFDPATGKPVAATLIPPKIKETRIGDLMFTTRPDEQGGTVLNIADKNGTPLPRVPKLVHDEIVNFLPNIDNASLTFDNPESFQIRLNSDASNDELVWDLKASEGNFVSFDSTGNLSKFKQYEGFSADIFGELSLNGLGFTAALEGSPVVEILKPEQNYGYRVLGADSKTDLTLISEVARGALLNEADDYQWTYNDKTNALILTIVNGENTDWKAYTFDPGSNAFVFEQPPEARTEKDEQVVRSNAELETLLFG